MNNDPNQAEPAAASPYAGLASKIRTGKTVAQAEYEATPPKVSITHRKTAAPGRGILKLFNLLTKPVLSPPLKVELDGVIVGSVEETQTLDIVTTAGPHRLRLLAPVSSATRDLELTNGQRLRFWCLSSISGIVFQRED